jgi:hypothetical protein
MEDQILTGKNPEADRRLMADVMAASLECDDAFDGGCPADVLPSRVPDRRGYGSTRTGSTDYLAGLRAGLRVVEELATQIDNRTELCWQQYLAAMASKDEPKILEARRRWAASVEMWSTMKQAVDRIWTAIDLAKGGA